MTLYLDIKENDEESLKIIKRINYCQYIGEFKNGQYHGKGNLLSYPYVSSDNFYDEQENLSSAHIGITVGKFKNGNLNGKYKVYKQGYLYMDANLNAVGTGKATIYFTASNQIEYKGGLRRFKYHGKGVLYKEDLGEAPHWKWGIKLNLFFQKRQKGL